jgi:CheY-like chemotaxis protein
MDLAMRLGLKADTFSPSAHAGRAISWLLKPIKKPHAPLTSAAKDQILIVDEDELLLDLLEHHLTRAGYQVAKAADGEAALALIGLRVPAVVILASMLPGVNGIEVLRRIRETPATRDVPVVILTHRKLEGDIVEALQLGASAYLTRPFLLGELMERVSKLITPYEHPMRTALDELAAERVAHSGSEPLLDQANTPAGARSLTNSGVCTKAASDLAGIC